MSVDPGSRGWNEHRHRPGPVQLDATGCTLWTVTGVPPATLGRDGDFAFRKDGSTGAAIYQRRAGAWVAVA